MKHQDQRIRGIEAKILTLELCAAELARAMSVSDDEGLPAMKQAFARLCEEQRAAILEWQRLNDPEEAPH